MEKWYVTVWSDGSWKVWIENEAYFARNDPTWVTDFSVEEVNKEASLGGTDNVMYKVVDEG